MPGGFTSALGESEKNLRAYEPFAQAHPAYLAQRVTLGTGGEAALTGYA